MLQISCSVRLVRTATMLEREAMILLFLITITVSCKAQHNSPKNVVGLVGNEVVLECHRNITTEVVWTFKKPGQEDETSIPGRYRKEMTNYGEHRLILEDIQFSDAGTYVCSSAVNPVDFKRFAAYVVVVAHQPHCSNSLSTNELAEGNQVSLTCWVSYVGIPEAIGVNMTWIGPDGEAISRGQFQTEPGKSMHRLVAAIIVRGSDLLPHRCLVEFDVVRKYEDVASNAPVLTTNSCTWPANKMPVRRRNEVDYTTSPRPEDDRKSSSRSHRVVTFDSMPEGLLHHFKVLVAVAVTSAVSCVVMVSILCCWVVYQLRRKKFVRAERSDPCPNCGLVNMVNPQNTSGESSTVATCTILMKDADACMHPNTSTAKAKHPESTISKASTALVSPDTSRAHEVSDNGMAEGDEPNDTQNCNSTTPLLDYNSDVATGRRHSSSRQTAQSTESQPRVCLSSTSLQSLPQHPQMCSDEDVIPDQVSLQPSTADDKDISLAERRVMLQKASASYAAINNRSTDDSPLPEIDLLNTDKPETDTPPRDGRSMDVSVSVHQDQDTAV